MAKSKQKKDSTMPLVVALVFFVLATIAFGVMWYTTNDQMAQKDEAVKAAEKKVTDLRTQAREAELVARVYRAYVGTADAEDLKSIGSEIKEGDATSAKAVAALKDLNDKVAAKEAAIVRERAGDKGADDKKGPDDMAAAAAPSKLAYWKPEFDGTSKTLKLPDTTGGLIALAVAAAGERDVADTARKTTVANYEPARAAAKDKAATFDAERTKYEKAAATVATQYLDKVSEPRAAADAQRKSFDKSVVDHRTEIKKLKEDLENLDLAKRRVEDQLKQALSNNTVLQERNTAKQDLFQYDEPQGRITRRVNDDVVEIDLGWVARVRPGLTFSVLPRDFPEKGRQSRIQVVRIPDEKGNFRPVQRFVPKANLEVIEVLGPNSSRARISDEDMIRDKVLPGDLLYNSVWRKGQADHVALVGIFDVNGDGSDDIETVVKDLTKMGVPVDAIFDLRTQKWVGRINEQTRYVVQGAFPTNTGNDPHREAKNKLLGALGEAMGEARAKGVPVTNYRDFFPRMGYRVKQDVSEDKVNQAAAKYLGGAVLEQPDVAPKP
jgi:hypothetical protein